MDIEACIHCNTLSHMAKSVQAAHAGGAARIELCADMSFDGLTPSREFIVAARAHFPRSGVLVMIRPRKGDFCYDQEELRIMQSQLDMASDSSADGVVFGILSKNDNVALSALEVLSNHCEKRNLQRTFHRAFDATPNRADTLEKLIELGFDRVLTSGTKWGEKGTAIDGIHELCGLIEQAQNRIEIVIGGGVSPNNATHIVTHLPNGFNRISLHSYSGIKKDGTTDAALVASLVLAANKHNQNAE